MCINCEYRQMKQQQASSNRSGGGGGGGGVVGAMLSLLFYSTVPSSSKLHGCIQCVGMKYCTCNRKK
ncbi:unknown [Spodoptera litura nucleopolyhedrovirus]|uniref:Uncharacterized protein n=1 Tax=Spodoptera litura multicapsid nucleopolyhedrovirus TaxID=46242 RepID=Q91BC5_NPVST|nr:hypothetical protein [Spodoptera litura nucleopolyhedrovirus]AAL01786.1 unknown [Spodoptera litura nucleopolyhedrovirus]QHN73953.1 hypothetical protein [Spodoptera litura nucleopolyhedrovirus]UQV25639.1 hypothetical protein [Spodoptera litura nucleopolyhedrovirus]WML75168.1 hypothetical protein KBIHDJOI_00126 [Spodoptera littoralis nucleopolyhedrovirus]